MVKIFLILFFTTSFLFSKYISNYEDIFVYLETKGVVIGKDISHDKLFEIINSPSLHPAHGVDKDLLYARILEFQEKSSKELDMNGDVKKEYNLNESKVRDKEILHFVQKNKNNEILNQNTKKSGTDEKTWFSEKLNELVEKLKL